MIRLGIMMLLFGLFILETFNFFNRGMQFELYRDIQCISFFVIRF